MKRLFVSSLIVLAAAPAVAHADTRVRTSLGGNCRIETFANSSRFGVRVEQCSSQRGVRYVMSSGHQIDINNSGTPPRLERKRSDVPHRNSRATNSNADRVVIDVEMVLVGAERRRARVTEKWRRPGRDCWVLGQRHARDTLRCEITERLG